MKFLAQLPVRCIGREKEFIEYPAGFPGGRILIQKFPRGPVHRQGESGPVVGMFLEEFRPDQDSRRAVGNDHTVGDCLIGEEVAFLIEITYADNIPLFQCNKAAGKLCLHTAVSNIPEVFECLSCLYKCFSCGNAF